MCDNFTPCIVGKILAPYTPNTRCYVLKNVEHFNKRPIKKG